MAVLPLPRHHRADENFLHSLSRRESFASPQADVWQWRRSFVSLENTAWHHLGSLVSFGSFKKCVLVKISDLESTLCILISRRRQKETRKTICPNNIWVLEKTFSAQSNVAARGNRREQRALITHCNPNISLKTASGDFEPMTTFVLRTEIYLPWYVQCFLINRSLETWKEESILKQCQSLYSSLYILLGSHWIKICLNLAKKYYIRRRILISLWTWSLYIPKIALKRIVDCEWETVVSE
jgi:hypothetical protein